ncbi:MAG: hypothetical protein NT051_06565 [Candidatus Micrarchaeota archaeon]|nr:hypothetical protein [Candidatus Micrarchaeota archaeon]
MANSTIWDVLSVSPTQQEAVELASFDIEELSKRLDKTDIALVYRYFRDELWLISRHQSHLASILMVVQLEKIMRDKLISKKTLKKEEIEKMQMPELGKNLLPENMRKIVNNLYSLRVDLIHGNMDGYKKRMAKNQPNDKHIIHALETSKKLEPDWEHTYWQINLDIDMKCGGWQKLFRSCLDIVKEIDKENLDGYIKNLDGRIIIDKNYLESFSASLKRSFPDRSK